MQSLLKDLFNTFEQKVLLSDEHFVSVRWRRRRWGGLGLPAGAAESSSWQRGRGEAECVCVCECELAAWHSYHGTK